MQRNECLENLSETNNNYCVCTLSPNIKLVNFYNERYLLLIGSFFNWIITDHYCLDWYYDLLDMLCSYHSFALITSVNVTGKSRTIPNVIIDCESTDLR